MPALYISVDEEKERLDGYHPAAAEQFHRESARRADKRFERALKESPCAEVILLSGGSASGKTEFSSEYLADRDCIVFDSTLPSAKGAAIKIRKVLHAGKRPVICAILPDELRRAFLAFLGRERKFSAKYFYRTHAGSRRTLLWIARHHPSVEIRIFESAYDPRDVLRFTRFSFPEHRQLLNFLREKQLTQRQIVGILRAV